jgi:stage V sporulation protein B
MHAMKQENSYNFSKGTTYLIIANIIFLISGYIVNIISARKLGPELYGIAGIIISIMTVFNLFLTSGFPRSAAKYLSENKQWDRDLINKTIKLQILFLIISIFCFYLISPLLSHMLGDNSLIYYFLLTTLVIPFYAIFSLFAEGFLNGYRQFKGQALATSVSSIAKVIIIFVLIMIGFNVEGIIFGYLIAAFIGFLIAFYYFKKIKIENQATFPIKNMIHFSLPIILFSIFMFLIFNIDLLSVKAILQSNIDTGYYNSASMIARAPYFIFLGLAISLFPSISYYTSTNNDYQIRKYISGSLRYMLLLLIPTLFIVNITAEQLLDLLFSNVYIIATGPLQILIFGLGALSIFNVLAYIIMGYGKTKIALITIFLIFILSIFLNIYLIPIFGMNGAAYATTLASIIGLFIIGAYVYKNFKVLVEPISFLKIVFSSCIIWGIGFIVRASGLLLIIEYLGLIAIYIGILWVIKEIKKEDLKMILDMLPKKLQKKES